MSSSEGLHFVGKPLVGGTSTIKFYEVVEGPSIRVQIGDAVRVTRHDGTFIGILLAMWSQGARRQKMLSEILWFDALAEDKKRPQELYITPESSIQDISQIQALVSITSASMWFAEGEQQQHKSKKSKNSRYFCECGFLERSQTKTAVFDWIEFYSSRDRTDLVAFQDKVVAFVTEAAKARLSKRLSSKLQTSRPKTVYITKEAASEDESEDNSDAESNRFSATGEWSDINHNHVRKRRSVQDLSDEENGHDSDIPKTPRKRSRTSASVANTPRTPRTIRTPRKSTKISTPGSKTYRIHAPLEVTPLPSRIKDLAHELHLSPHQLARQRLHVAEVPTSLPCREEEFASIFDQVESAILENESALIYVSGTPGTGKTATVREVINALQQRVQEEELFPFKFVEINGMKIPDPTQAYSKLWEALTGQRVTANHALSLLQTQFTTSNPARMPCVVLMDELDQLTTTKQEVMYNFFQWPNMPNTRLIVVAVANTMDLPERTLAHKVSSRLGLTRIAFTAYTRPQLKEIIKSRLASVESIDVDDAAIDYACLRVSRVSGDARRALDICRRAFELAEPGFASTTTSTPATEQIQDGKAEQSAGGRITMAIMQKAFNEMTSSPLQIYLKSLPFASKIFLKALMACIRRSGLTETSFGDVVDDAGRMCRVNTAPELPILMGLGQPYGMARVAHDLADGGVIYLERGKGERSARVRLKVPESDLLSSWSEDVEFAKIT